MYIYENSIMKPPPKYCLKKEGKEKEVKEILYR
jgi:hypothetical protein